MKRILVLTIGVYQKLLSNILKNILGVDRFCRFSPSCSQYSKQAILSYGIIKGCQKSVARFLKCQPFYKKI